MIWLIIEYYITVKCLKNTMFVFTQKLLNRNALQWILHCWPFEWREGDDSRLWRHKFYLVTSQIQRGRLYDSATWPPSLEQPSPAHYQRGQTFCERRCLFVIFYSCCCCWCFCCSCWWWCCCCWNPIICADLRGTAPAPLVSVSPPPATPKTHSSSVVAPPAEVHRKWRQVVCGLSSEGDTALLLSHLGGVHWCLFWFSIRRASLAMPHTVDSAR